ncbi:hypothetical protein B9Z55_016359 [Caenorhabditis nigoni]|nr:hypothetical protein B9Z55_016359 [Caenorhabditis nigoni]
MLPCSSKVQLSPTYEDVIYDDCQSVFDVPCLPVIFPFPLSIFTDFPEMFAFSNNAHILHLYPSHIKQKRPYSKTILEHRLEMIKSSGSGQLLLLKNLKIVRKSEERVKRKIILRAFAVNFLVLLYYFGFTAQTKQYRDLHFSSGLIPPYINIRSDLFVRIRLLKLVYLSVQISPKYNILSCGIRKSMSQLLINIMCLLHNEAEFLNQKRSLNDTWMSERVCSHKDLKFHIPQKIVDSDSKFRNLTKFAFIRDPFDRFISFYLHICKNDNGCWDCGDDMRCVVQNVYKSLKNYEKNPDESTSSLVDRHAAPISW